MTWGAGWRLRAKRLEGRTDAPHATRRSACLAVLRNSPHREFTAQQVGERLTRRTGASAKAWAETALKDLCRDGLVERRGNGRYRIGVQS